MGRSKVKKSVRIVDNVGGADGKVKTKTGQGVMKRKKMGGIIRNNPATSGVGEEVTSGGSDDPCEVKIDSNCTVYLMGETKSRPVCTIEVAGGGNGEGVPSGGQNENKVQIHIFLPLTTMEE